MELKDKLKDLRSKKNMTQEELAARLGFGQVSLARYETGRRHPNSTTLKKIANFYNVSIDYLLGNVSNASFEPDEENMISINVYGGVPAGVPIETVDNIVSKEFIPSSWTRGGRSYFGIRLHGDSMMPEFRSGDTVIIKEQQACNNGEYCLVSVDDVETTFKKVILKNDQMILQPLNPEFPPMVYSSDEVENLPVKILGVFYELRRRG